MQKRRTSGRPTKPVKKGRGPQRGTTPHVSAPKLDENAVSLLQKVPRTMVFRRGAVGETVKQLIGDLRHVMSPNTAQKLKERKKNTMADFLRVASALHVTHFMTLSQTALSLHLRISRLPRGPTVTFRVLSYSTIKSVRATQKSPAGFGAEYSHAPLVVLNNFTNNTDAMKITTATLQNMFPGLDLANIRLHHCRRVVLFHYDPENDSIQFRHYSISAVPVGLTRSVRKLVMGKLPSLHEKTDIAEYLDDPTLSESESEMNTDIRVSLAQSLKGKGNHANHTSAIKLKELGPRMTLELYKITDGFNDGHVIYNRYVTKTDEELAIIEASKKYDAKVKEQRRQTQEDNILRKQREKLEHRQEQIDKMNESKRRQAEKMNDSDDDDDNNNKRGIQEADSDGNVSIGDFDDDDDNDNDDYGYMGDDQDEDDYFMDDDEDDE